MRIFFILFAVYSFIVISIARADMVIVQKVEGAGQTGDMTIKIKEGKIRADISSQISTITDGANGDVITLMHAQKSFMKIPTSTTKELMDRMKNMQSQQQPGGSPVGTPKLQATGKKEKINGYDTEQYTWETGAMKVSYWIAKDFPNYAVILSQMDKLQQTGLSSLTKGMTPGAADFQGMPIKTEVDMEGQKITTTISSVKEELVNATEFEVPADYKEMPMPSFSAPTQ